MPENRSGRALRRRERRAILAQMPYRPCEEWADTMVTVRRVQIEEIVKAEKLWQVDFCGYRFPGVPDKDRAEAFAKDLKRAIRKKLRHYAAQEKRALLCRLGFREKNGLNTKTGLPL